MESTRKIGRHHLAFYRGWLQGIDLKVAADRYLESGLDQRIARSTLAWIQQALAMAARRHGRHALARLLRLPLGTLPEAVRATTAPPRSKLSALNTTPITSIRRRNWPRSLLSG